MAQTGQVPSADSGNPAEDDSKPAERPGKFAVTGLLAALAAALAAVLLVDSTRRISSGLLIFAGLTLVVLWAFTGARESQWFMASTMTILTAALIGAGCFLFFIPVKHTAPGSGPTVTVTATPIPTQPAVPSSAPVQLGPITSPVDGDNVGPYVNLRGSVSDLKIGQMIWTFDEPFAATGRPTGTYYPNRGPCTVTGKTWACDHIGLGNTGTAIRAALGNTLSGPLS